MIVSVLVVCAFTLLLYWLKGFLRFRRMVNAFPGPTAHPIFGDVLSLSSDPETLFQQVRQLSKDYPNGFKMWGGHIGTVNLLQPDDVEVILSSMKYIEKSTIYNLIHPWLETGLLTSTGTKWQQRRKILTPAFHFNILRRFVVIFNEHCNQLVEDIKEECNKTKTNVIPLISKLTLNAICETAMGTNLDPTDEKQSNYRKAIYGLAPLIIGRIVRPWFYYDWIFNLFPMGRQQNKYLKCLHQFTKDVIVGREANFKMSDVENLDEDDDGMKKKKRLAMLDLLISAKNNGEFIDDQGIREEVDTFMFEGHDTSSMALCFALMLLANHKEIQDNIVAELKTIFGDSKRSASFEDLQNMKYMEMCLKECLRLYPSVPFISRMINEDVSLKNFTVPAGCATHIHIYDLHRNPEFFPDPEKFDPERFSPENSQGRHPYSYIPFSAGPRNCIGQRFAFLEMKCIISSILRHYAIEPVDAPGDLILVIDIVLRTKNDINVKFRPRTL